MNHTESGKVAVGSLGSVARFISEKSWGVNKFAVLERVNGEFIVRAAQSTKQGALRYWQDGFLLVDIDNVRILSWSGSVSISCAALAQIELALEGIKITAASCLQGDTPLVALQTFASPIRKIVTLAASALENIPKETRC